jgi:hypothetical protein
MLKAPFIQLARTAVPVTLLMLVAGCVPDSKGGGGGKGVGAPPSLVRPTTMFMAAQSPRDTNNNGYLDTCVVTVYLFQSDYARSVQSTGTYTFTLLGRGGKVLRTWELTSPGPNIASVNAGVGPGYVIKISMLEGGTDEMPSQSVDIAAVFTDPQGNRVEATPATVFMGRV